MRSTGMVVRVFDRLIAERILTRESTILVVCGDLADRRIFSELGFTNVVISSNDERENDEDYSPFEWNYQDAQALTYPDNSFDFAFVYGGLHHCQSPHRALTEMYRVSRAGLVAVEARDSLLMRTAIRLGLADDYEVRGVRAAGGRGGMNGGCIPNYVYRWTEREFTKTIATFDPTARHRCQFFYSMQIHHSADSSRLRRLLTKLAWPILILTATLFPKQCNEFGVAVLKPRMPDDLWPWLAWKDGEVRLDENH